MWSICINEILLRKSDMVCLNYIQIQKVILTVLYQKHQTNIYSILLQYF